jgi:hypothetical protein
MVQQYMSLIIIMVIYGPLQHVPLVAINQLIMIVVLVHHVVLVIIHFKVQQHVYDVVK